MIFEAPGSVRGAIGVEGIEVPQVMLWSVVHPRADAAEAHFQPCHVQGGEGPIGRVHKVPEHDGTVKMGNFSMDEVPSYGHFNRQK